MCILGSSAQGGAIKGAIFSTDSRVIFHRGSNRAARASKGVSLRSLRFDLVCVNCEYLVDVAHRSKLSPMSNSKCTLSGRMPASIFKAGLDVALYAPVIIRVAFFCTNSNVAK